MFTQIFTISVLHSWMFQLPSDELPLVCLLVTNSFGFPFLIMSLFYTHMPEGYFHWIWKCIS